MDFWPLRAAKHLKCAVQEFKNEPTFNEDEYLMIVEDNDSENDSDDYEY